MFSNWSRLLLWRETPQAYLLPGEKSHTVRLLWMFLSTTDRNVQRRDQSLCDISSDTPSEATVATGWAVCADSSLDGLHQDWIYCLSNDQRSTAEPSIARWIHPFPRFVNGNQSIIRTDQAYRCETTGGRKNFPSCDRTTLSSCTMSRRPVPDIANPVTAAQE